MAKTNTSTRELKYYVARAREQKLLARRGVNGGGWIALAAQCGAGEDVLTKSAAKSFLRTKFGMPANSVDIAHRLKLDHQARSVNALNEKLAKPRTNWVASDDFLKSYEWRKLRLQALKLHGARCQCCGASPATGAVMNVDHIKPRKLFPHLALALDNLQVLCHDCNHGKGNWDQTDWRPAENDYTETDNVVPFLRSIANER